MTSPIRSSPQQGVIFRDNVFRESDLMGLLLTQTSAALTNDALAQTIRDIQKQVGPSVPCTMETFYPVIVMQLQQPAVLELLGVKHFVLDRHLLCGSNLPDIGLYIRNIIMGTMQDTTMSRLIHFSMPYIKHNRLHFCKYNQTNLDELHFKCRLILATCLGTHSGTSKKPLWVVQFQVMHQLYTLLTRGNARDLYTFCQAHPNLLRIAVIEYFIVFITNHMPLELSFLSSMLDMEGRLSQCMRQLFVIVDSFRSTSVQNETFSWANMELKAQACAEKCNRICKGKSKYEQSNHKMRSLVPSVKREGLSVSPDEVIKALNVPHFSSSIYARLLHAEVSTQSIAHIAHVHNVVQVQPLPFNFVLQQIKALRNAIHMQGHLIVQSAEINACMQCCLKQRPIPINKTRIDECGDMKCIHCDTKQYMIAVNTIGRIVTVHNTSYYFCHECLKTHEWTGCGHELVKCPYTEKVTEARPHMCVFCEKTNGLEHLTLLDSTLGITSRLPLCNTHMPCKFQVPYVNTYEGYWRAMQHKRKLYG